MGMNRAHQATWVLAGLVSLGAACTPRGFCTFVSSSVGSGPAFGAINCIDVASGICFPDGGCTSTPGFDELCDLATSCPDPSEVSRSTCTSVLPTPGATILTATCRLDSGECFLMTTNADAVDNHNCINPGTGVIFAGVTKLCNLSTNAAPTSSPTSRTPTQTPTSRSPTSSAPSVRPTASPVTTTTTEPTPQPSAFPTASTASPTTVTPTPAPSQGCQGCTVDSQCGGLGQPVCTCQFTSGTRNGQCTGFVVGTGLCFSGTELCANLVYTPPPTEAPRTATPTTLPTKLPTPTPTLAPSVQPTAIPTKSPSGTACPGGSSLSNHPQCVEMTVSDCSGALVQILCPTLCNTCPTPAPTLPPTVSPTAPTAIPTASPTFSPSSVPTDEPTTAPTTTAPTFSPSSNPTAAPTKFPTPSCPFQGPDPDICRIRLLTESCSSVLNQIICPAHCNACTDVPTATPTAVPTVSPTSRPTHVPSVSPSASPSENPTVVPSAAPTTSPTVVPTPAPSTSPTAVPSASPTDQPTASPTNIPTVSPTSSPTDLPSESPSATPTLSPTAVPTEAPSTSPTRQPTTSPSVRPSTTPTFVPSHSPTATPTDIPSSLPTVSPTTQPTQVPSSSPTSGPTSIPSLSPSAQPSGTPSARPTTAPSRSPTEQPTAAPSLSPSAQPSAAPTSRPSISPSASPSALPTAAPSAAPTDSPTANPTTAPTLFPTPACSYGVDPEGCRGLTEQLGCSGFLRLRCPAHCNACTSGPTFQPTVLPTLVPTAQPSVSPTASPTNSPSDQPTFTPTVVPSARPTTLPTQNPTGAPTDVCGVILCSDQCRAPENPGCGWSSPRSLCVQGANTQLSELGLGVCAPTPSTTLSPTLPPVESFSCAAPLACAGGVESIRHFANGTVCYCASGCEAVQGCCPDYEDVCVTSAPSPATVAPATVSPVTVGPTVAPIECGSITCSDQCLGACGWSRNQNICKAGARTSSSEVGLGPGCVVSTTTAAPTTSDATTASPTVQPDCGAITCSDQCTGLCGWSSNRNICKLGGRTTGSEAGLGPGCTLSEAPSAAGATLAPSTVTVDCVTIHCSDQCTGSCGWSRNRNACVAGGRTTGSEAGLGPGCTSAAPTAPAQDSGRVRSEDNPNGR
eukprot:m.446023 g.446023  ORF g.446023 m.446023 type:complete len:1134 (-) comp19302_c0_seq1:1247-4648(-)